MRRLLPPALLLALLACALPALLPAGALAAGGSDVVLEGRLVTIHSDDFAHGRSTVRSQLETAQGAFDLDLAPDQGLPRGERVRVHGVRTGSTVAVAAGGVTPAAGSTVIAATTGAKRVLVVLVRFADNSTQPVTQAAANGIVFTNANSVAAYYSTVSWGKLTLSGDVTPWVTIPSTNEASSCDFNTWGAQANTAAQNAGYTPSNYSNVQYVLNQAPACGWAGLAYMPGTTSWVLGQYLSLRVSAHELGHNFGTHHSNSYWCYRNGVRVALSTPSDCSTSEYGDPFSVMGAASTYEHTNFSRGNFGFFATANTQDVTTSGTYALRQIEPSSPTSVQALRINRGNGTYLLLEFRQPDGALFDNFSATSPQATGVTVRVVPAYTSLLQSQLVDSTPGTSTFADAPLGVNQSIADPVANVTLTTTAAGSSGATVRVTFAGQAPANTSVPTISGTARQGQTLTASPGTWTGSPTSYAYQWQRSVGGVWQSIAGATATTYVPVSGDVGYPLRVQVVASNAAGPSQPASSVATAAVQAAAVPVNSTAPAISGAAKQGLVLTAAPGTWTNSPTSYSYQWQRYSGGWQSIAGATASTYTPAAADVWTALRVQVVAVNASGSSAPAYSAATANVLPAAPASTSAPTISGTPKQGLVLTASPGTWTNSPTSYSYQWQRYSGGWQSIAGATASTYTPGAGDVWSALRVQVVASNAGGSSSPAYSAPTAAVSP